VVVGPVARAHRVRSPRRRPHRDGRGPPTSQLTQTPTASPDRGHVILATGDRDLDCQRELCRRTAGYHHVTLHAMPNPVAGYNSSLYPQKPPFPVTPRFHVKHSRNHSVTEPSLQGPTCPVRSRLTFTTLASTGPCPRRYKNAFRAVPLCAKRAVGSPVVQLLQRSGEHVFRASFSRVIHRRGRAKSAAQISRFSRAKRHSRAFARAVPEVSPRDIHRRKCR
jgi:hypothetical protein